MLVTLAAAGLLLVAAAAVARRWYTPDIAPGPLERSLAGPGSGSRFVEVDGVRLHYRDEGAGAPLLLLHGLTANLFSWDRCAGLLAGKLRVVRLDLPGHGLTGPHPAGRYGWADLASLAARFLDELGIERASVAGSSLGGAVAWQLAARFPERVARMILLAPIGYPMPGKLPWPLRLLAHPVLGPALSRFTPRREFMKRLATTYGDPARIDARDADRQFRLFRRAGNRAALSAFLRGGPFPDPRPLLARITAPTLLLWGSRDMVAHPAAAERFARDIPGAKVQLIEGAGHAPMTELPEETAAAILAFLGEDA
jgi:pimeloyl-ACP methyl ester carboxylesterase